MTALEQLAFTAFLIGIVSAISLPLGALHSFLWRPEPRVVAALMAFGGGALLAALAIDLVAPAVEHGHFGGLTLGGLAGGLIFFLLDKAVSNFGGYRRKHSSVVVHRNTTARKNLIKIMQGLGRTTLFSKLQQDDEVRFIADHVETRFYAKGSILYMPGDPSETLYMVGRGCVELETPGSTEAPEVVGENSTFGLRPFFTGTPHAKIARTTRDSWIPTLPKETGLQLLEASSAFREAVSQWLLTGKDIRKHLRAVGMDDAEIAQWRDQVREEVDCEQSGHLPDAKPFESLSDRFAAFVAAHPLERIPWLEDMSPNEAEQFGHFLTYRRYKAGEKLYEQCEPANYFYIIDHGEVTLRDMEDRSKVHTQDMGDAIGSFAFLCDLRHTMSAEAKTDIGVWAFRRHDLGRLIRHYPNFGVRLAHNFKSRAFNSYLQQRYNLDQGRVLAWVSRARKAVQVGKMPPSMLEMGIESTSQHGASVAIWLGILLDSIPESFVIGAKTDPSGGGLGISLALVAGLFLSNYPEALSSSRGMREEGFSRFKILAMWVSIALFTGIGAAFGSLMQGADPYWLSLLEGLAAGAMLTMIAQTMLPEAYSKGGSIIGLATLLGFFLTISLKAVPI